MAAARVDRRLAAILAADVVGYSRLIERDEAGTLERLKAHRKSFIEPLIAEHHGRIVKLMGDGALCEFGSVVDAVACAIATQRGMAEREPEIPEDQRIRFRIGINLGDVVSDEGDLYGDGVNVAARLEQLAQPGGIVISGTAYDHLQGKLGCGFQDLGEQRVKNVARPVRAYQVVSEPAAVSSVGRESPWSRRLGMATSALGSRAGGWWGATMAALVALMAIGAGIFGWLQPWQGSDEMTEPTLDTRRVAVLPFANISADAADEYFADGMTEELISKLSRLHDLTVIARTSVMQYKDAGKGITEIGRELQVGTILEGSVRRAGDRLRITAQLVDVASQGHLWSQDYDRTLDDVFAIQGDVAQHVAQALQIALKPAEKSQLAKAGTDDLDAYSAYLQGLYHYNTWSKEGLEKSIEYYKQAITRDPDFAQAYAAMAFSYQMLADLGYLPPDDGFSKVKQAARRALEIDATTAEAYTALAVAATYHDYDWIRADEGFRRALELNPSSAVTYDWYGIVYLSAMGRHDEAGAHIKRAKELDPLTPYIRSDLGWAYNQARRYDEAVAECQQIPQIDPEFAYTYSCLGFAYWQKGRLEKAIEAYEHGGELEPEDLHLKADLAIVYAAAGKGDPAQKILEEFEEKARREYVPPYALAMVRMALGDLDGTFAWLNRMYEERAPWLIWMNEHPRYDGLRGDPRFQQLVRKIGFTEPKFPPASASD